MTAFLVSGAPYTPPRVPLAVVHADAAVLVVDKPAGLLSVPGKDPALSDCLEARVRAEYPEALLLHRLDMDTSGLMVFARTRNAQRHIARQFNNRRMGKTYVALVAGTPPGPSGRVDAPLACDWERRPRQKITPEGRESITDWEVIGHEADATRLRVHPLTGRSHQIRVHLQSIGLPILGDGFYAPAGARAARPRLCLHAAALAFRHPEGGARVEYRAPAPF